MDIFFKNIRQATSFIIIFLGFLFFSSQVSLVMADTVTTLPISIWGTTIYSLPFSACPGGTGGTVYTIPWTGNCCSIYNTSGTPCGTTYYSIYNIYYYYRDWEQCGGTEAGGGRCCPNQATATLVGNVAGCGAGGYTYGVFQWYGSGSCEPDGRTQSGVSAGSYGVQACQ